jgi:hypothetical protein
MRFSIKILLTSGLACIVCFPSEMTIMFFPKNAGIFLQHMIATSAENVLLPMVLKVQESGRN